MDTLSAEALVVLALANGPAAGSELTERARALTGDPRVLGAGTIYPALRRLKSAGVLRSWAEGERSGVGRPRRFNELTAAGVQALDRQRSLLQALVAKGRPARPSRGMVRLMRANLRRAFAVSALGSRLQAAVRRAGGGRTR
jgi:DNA-binding PadR family transcriptional regulator